MQKEHKEVEKLDQSGSFDEKEDTTEAVRVSSLSGVGMLRLFGNSTLIISLSFSLIYIYAHEFINYVEQCESCSSDFSGLLGFEYYWVIPN